MTISLISAVEAHKKLQHGAILIDIRQPDEYRREHIQGSVSHPLAQLQAVGLPVEIAKTNCIIFHCKSGMRTQNAKALIAQLTEQGGYDVFILEKGLDGWKNSGLETQVDRSQPLELMRQVQIAAGLLVLIGVILGWTISPVFYGLSAFVGAGLTFAGVTGFCGLARLLAIMPWNRQ